MSAAGKKIHGAYLGRPDSHCIPVRRRGERGSALMAALLVSAVLMSVVLVTFHNSDSASRSVAVQDSNAQSLAAAEYGANRAIGEMSAWFTIDNNRRLDWVFGETGETLYVDSSSVAATDHRRFSGIYLDQEFRVMVRSAALAKGEDGTKKDKDKWLWEPAQGEGLYEIIAAARPIDITSQPPERRTSATLQTVVSVNF